MRLYDELLRLSENGRVPFHMPGHGRNPDFDDLGSAASIDFTEIEGLDNLHAAKGILKDAMDRAARVYGADRAFFLVNGSTVGMLSAIFALCRGGGSLLLARNAHRSAYHAAMLARAPLFYLNPDRHPLGFSLDIRPEDVKAALEENPAVAAVAVTSPTYDGVVSDIAGIAEACHARGIPLLVDAAHGSHLGFLDPTVPSPVSLGADVTVMSLHKTLPALTQSALLCVRGALVDAEKIAASLAVFETSSPSYPLMASADGCVARLTDSAFTRRWSARIAEIRREAGEFFTVPATVHAFDESKLILRVPGYSGAELSSILREGGIEPEMTAPDYVLLMTTAGTTDAHVDALLRILSALPRLVTSPEDGRYPASALPARIMHPWEAEEAEQSLVSPEKAARDGLISADFVTPYPPGIPLLVPGERIGEREIREIRRFREKGIAVLTSSGSLGDALRVVKEET